MRIGLLVGEVRGQSALPGILAEARDASGFDSFWSAQAFGLDALMTLTAVGAVTTGAELGTAIVPTPTRHPLVLASQALTVQAATGNRLTLGIGAGIAAMTSGMFGLPDDRRASRMREYLSVLLPLLRGEPVAHTGDTLTAVGTVTVPGTTPPPVLVAAMGPAMLRVARDAAGTVTWMTGPRTLATHVVPALGEGARVVAGLLVCVTADEQVARERVDTEFAMAAQVPEYRAVLDREGATGPGDVIIAGDEDAIARQLDRLRDAGVTDFLAAPFGTPEEQRRTRYVLAAARVA